MVSRRNDRQRVEFFNASGKKRGRDIAHFRRGMEHMGQLLVPVQRGDRRM
jgi:hypothetical protein